MKLQIMSRLQHFETPHLDVQRALQLDKYETQQEKNPLSPFDFQGPIMVERKICGIENSKKQKEGIKKFFINFHSQTIIKHQKVQNLSQPARRQLAPILSSMLALKEEHCPPVCLVSAFTVNQADNLPVPSKETQQKRTVKSNYYFKNTKQRNKVLKVSSLANIKTETSVHVNRRPGCILRKNYSLSRKQSLESSLNVSNNQNMDPNQRTLRRMSSRKKVQNVDKQILQSKQRIVRIRRELNDIYQLKKPNSVRLKLL